MTKYICIKPFPSKYTYIEIGDIVEIEFDQIDSYEGIHTIFYNYHHDLTYKTYILKLDLDHFITLAEWRDRQINSILEDE
jgi:hypothetical protein